MGMFVPAGVVVTGVLDGTGDGIDAGGVGVVVGVGVTDTVGGTFSTGGNVIGGATEVDATADVVVVAMDVSVVATAVEVDVVLETRIPGPPSTPISEGSGAT